MGKKTKEYQSPETYRKFLAYTHIRTPSGKKAQYPSQTISALTPTRKKEKVVKVGGKTHKPKITKKKKRR